MDDALRIHATVRRVGNSLAMVIPADVARRAGVRPGDVFDADLRRTQQPLLGALKGRLPYVPFDRRSLGDDRV